MVANRVEWLTTLPADSVGCEVGVQLGRFSKQILEIVNPRILYLVDHWTSNMDGVRGRVRRERQRHFLWEAMGRLVEWIARGQARPICAWSEKAATLLPDQHLDWVYIDAQHTYRRLTEDLTAWFPKVKIGGTIAGHDYNQDGLVKAVADFTVRKSVTNVEVTTDPFPDERNSPPSFFFRRLA